MAVKPSLWDRVLRLIMSDKSYVLRNLKREQLQIETNVNSFALDVEKVELSIADTILNLRNLEGRQVENEDRLQRISIKVEGVTQDFQDLQNKRKHDQANIKAELLEELVNEQVGLEKTIAENRDRVKEQNLRVRNLRRNLTEMKELLRNAEDKKDDLNARYSAVQAMSKAQATLELLESHQHSSSVSALESSIRKSEASLDARAEVREMSEEKQFAELERSMAVSDRIKQITTPQKGIQ